MLFRKFAGDFADKYKCDPIMLDDTCENIILNYKFPGNIRQLKNIVYQMSILEKNKIIEPAVLEKYLPENEKMFLSINKKNNEYESSKEEMNFIYNMILELKKENNEIKKLLFDILKVKSMQNNKLINEKTEI